MPLLNTTPFLHRYFTGNPKLSKYFLCKCQSQEAINCIQLKNKIWN